MFASKVINFIQQVDSHSKPLGLSLATLKNSKDRKPSKFHYYFNKSFIKRDFNLRLQGALKDIVTNLKGDY